MEESELIKQVKEEYEKKLKEQEEKHKQEIEEIKKQEEEKRIKDIKALISGRDNEDTKKEKEKNEGDKSFYDMALEETLNNFNIKLEKED